MEKMLNLRNLLACAILSLASFSLAESVTLMSPTSQTVPEGEIFELKCVSHRIRTNGSRAHNELYKVEGSSRFYLSQFQAEAGETNYTKQGTDRATVVTVFRLLANENSAGSYGCVPVLENATRPSVFTASQKRREVAVRVCSEPELQVNRIDGEVIDGEVISVTADESCGYQGELTWRVNGRQAPRTSTPDAGRFPVVEREDNSLEIRSAGCLEVMDTTCEVTAVFTYISTEKRVSSASKMIQIPSCCVQDVFRSAEVTTNSDMSAEPVIYQPHPQEDDKHNQEREVLDLERQVLELKLEALPMQIKFLRRLNRDHSQARDMEKVADI